MKDLQNYLHKIPPESNGGSSLISILSCDSSFEDVLMNWLISATVNTHPPLSHVLILSLDQGLHRTLVKHGFDSVYVHSKELLVHADFSAFYVVLIVRLTVMRLLNHWGYDAANYDTDAVILKNPKHLYYGELQSSDFIGSRGKFPLKAVKKFGMALCAGVFMVKSSPETGDYKEEVRDWDVPACKYYVIIISLV